MADTTWYSPSQDTFVITNAEQLTGLALIVNGNSEHTQDSFFGKTISLGDHCDLSEYSWTPIGLQNYPFRGVFDGRGHSILNLTVDATNNYTASGFFGVIGENGLVKRTAFLNADINAGAAGGVIVGIIENGGIIENCYTTGELTKANGGIAGWVRNNAIVRNCYSTAIVKATAIGGGGGSGTSCGSLIGGMVNNGIVENCLGISERLYDLASGESGAQVGRVVAFFSQASGSLNNAAFNLMERQTPSTSRPPDWTNIWVDNSPPRGVLPISISEINNDITVGGRFLPKNLWQSQWTHVISLTVGGNTTYEVTLPAFIPLEVPPPPPPPEDPFDLDLDYEWLSDMKSVHYECGELLEWQRGVNYNTGDYVYDPGECRFYECVTPHRSEASHREEGGSLNKSGLWRWIRERKFEDGLNGSRRIDKKGEIVVYLSRGDVTITPRWYGLGQKKLAPPLLIIEDGDAPKIIYEAGNTHRRCTVGGAIYEVGNFQGD